MYQASPKIPTEGLIFYVDAASKLSTKSDNSFHDITGNYPRGYSSPNVINGATFSSDFGGYWSFDGTDDYAKYGQRAYASGFIENSPLNRNMTVISWIRTDSNHSGVFFSGNDASNTRACFQMGKRSSGELYISWFMYQTKNYNYNSRSTDSPVSNNEWHQFSVTVEGYAASNVYEAGLQFYLNGVAVDADDNNITKRSTGTIANPLIVVGRQQEGSTSTPFNGDISSIKMYERILSADEIKQDYNAIGPRFGFDSI